MMRFSIFGIALLTAFVALAIELGVLGDFLAWAVGAIILGFGVLVPVALLVRLNHFLASKLAVRFSEGLAMKCLAMVCGKMRLSLVLSNHAMQLAGQGEHEAALSFYKKAASLTPENVNARVNVGAGYYYVGDWSAAIEAISEVLAVQPNHPDALGYRGLALFAFGRYKESIEDLDRFECADASRHYVALVRGHAREVLQDWTGAISDYRLASKLEEGDLTAPLCLARLLSGCPIDELRDGEQAVEIAHRACVRSGWKDWIAVSVLAAAYAEIGNFKKAQELAEMVIELAPQEEKAERIKRVERYRLGQPFRISDTQVQQRDVSGKSLCDD